MKSVLLPDGTALPALGLGTWRVGEWAASRQAEVAALRHAISLGYRLFDTAEMYGEGGAESVLGEALRGAMAAGEVTREELFVVSKVYPHHADRRAAVEACARSLARLGLEWLDLYLLHWRGPVRLAETVRAFEALREDGRIRRWGVSNFDVPDMKALSQVAGGGACVVNQVWYSASQRAVEFDLLPLQRAQGIPLMAYSPIDQSALAHHDTLAQVGRRIGATAAQVALAWTLRDGGVVAIPKALVKSHLRDNLQAASLTLDAADLALIDRAFPPPRRRRALAMN